MVLLTATVGSRLHGLYDANSDWDYKTINVSPLKEIISPFKKQAGKETIGETEDNCVYEFVHFAKLLKDCNATVLEVLWARDFKEKHKLADELIDGRKKLLHKEKIFYAHRGYAHDQREKLLKGSTFARQKKALVAYIRIMKQGISLLETGDFNPVIKEAMDAHWQDVLYRAKYELKEDEIVDKSTSIIVGLEAELQNAYDNCTQIFEPDVAWLEDLLLRTYVELGYVALQSPKSD